MRNSRFVKLDNDVLLEYVYDNDNFITNDYRIIIDTTKKTRSFSDIETTNKSENQLFLLEKLRNRWGIIDTTETNKYLFLQYQNYSGSVPFNYNIVRLHFPVNYTFKDKLGILVNIGLYNNDQTKIYNISNYFFDKTDPNRHDIEFTTPPFLFQQKLWGKYIELQIPSPNALINDVNINNGVKLPRAGTIHKNLLSSEIDILSSETPIIINFQFLTKKDNKLDQISYLTTEPFNVTLPVTAEYEQIGLKIVESDDNDYFEIYGTYNDNISEFSSFINRENLLGKRLYITYDVAIYEKNIRTNLLTFIQSDTFNRPIEFRPIIKYSTTTAVIDVTMKLINAVDDSVVIRKSNYSMIQEQVSKYPSKLTKINVANTYKPKIYNTKQDRLNINFTNNISDKEIVNVPSVVMYERYNVNVKNISENVNDTLYYGMGQMQIMLYPSDNILKFAIANGKNELGYIPFSIPTSNATFLQFKNNDTLVEISLYIDSNEVNMEMGILIFLIYEKQLSIIKSLYDSGYDQFYIVMKNLDNIYSIIYAGRYLLYNS